MIQHLTRGNIIGKGKRGIVYKGFYGRRRCAIKITNTNSTAIGRIAIEAEWLQKLNKKKIGPTYYTSDKTTLVMEYLDGVHLSVYLKTETPAKKEDILRQIFDQCSIMDRMNVNKFEMHSITKNAIVVKNKVTLIDFERCKHTEDPKNVTQFCQFLRKQGYGKNTKEILRALKLYKEQRTIKERNALRRLFF